LLRALRYSWLMSWVHIFSKAFFNFGTGEIFWLFCLLLMKFKAFSIGLRCGEFPSQSMDFEGLGADKVPDHL
jgi:hypothetical protein